jgi:hypothetical protein
MKPFLAPRRRGHPASHLSASSSRPPESRTSAARLSISRVRLLLALTFTLTLTFTITPLAFSQWQNPTYTLRGGWNAIYLHGDATHASPAALFAANPEILSVWRWNPNPNPVQLNASSLVPTASSPEWSVWMRDEPTQSTLASLTGQNAYLVRCAGTATDTYNLILPQRVLPPRSTWVRNGANFLGFPSQLGAASTYPFFSQYFATFPAAIAANTRIYKYIGGDVGPANPIQVFSPASERLDRNQAYWFDATVVGNFYAPLEVTPSNLDGLVFGRTGAVITVRVRNRTAAAVTLTVSSVDSATPPTGQESIVGRVPLTRRTYTAATATYTETPLASAFNEVIPPQSSVELTFGIDRTAMTGTTDALYASLLRLTDSGNLLDIYLPATARVTSLGGLWVGDVDVTHVESKAAGSPGATTPRSYPLRVIFHVDETGTARLLSQVFMGRLAPAPHDLGLCTREGGLKPDDKANATRLVAVHLPLDTEVSTGAGAFAIGETLVRTVSIPFNERTNPFVHAYHPDHDNKSPRGSPLSAGVESHTLARQLRFTFTAAPPSGDAVPGWGSTVLGGTYTEVVTGLHKQSITVNGTFQLRRVSEISRITLN